MVVMTVSIKGRDMNREEGMHKALLLEELGCRVSELPHEIRIGSVEPGPHLVVHLLLQIALVLCR